VKLSAWLPLIVAAFVRGFYGLFAAAVYTCLYPPPFLLLLTTFRAVPRRGQNSFAR
jgi:hypothetical protein